MAVEAGSVVADFGDEVFVAEQDEGGDRFGGAGKTAGVAGFFAGGDLEGQVAEGIGGEEGLEDGGGVAGAADGGLVGADRGGLAVAGEAGQVTAEVQDAVAKGRGGGHGGYLVEGGVLGRGQWSPGARCERFGSKLRLRMGNDVRFPWGYFTTFATLMLLKFRSDPLRFSMVPPQPLCVVVRLVGFVNDFTIMKTIIDGYEAVFGETIENLLNFFPIGPGFCDAITEGCASVFFANVEEMFL